GWRGTARSPLLLPDSVDGEQVTDATLDGVGRLPAAGEGGRPGAVAQADRVLGEVVVQILDAEYHVGDRRLPIEARADGKAQHCRAARCARRAAEFLRPGAKAKVRCERFGRDDGVRLMREGQAARTVEQEIRGQCEADFPARRTEFIDLALD